MNYLSQIQVEFSKLAMSWDDLSYDEQKGYLKRHPKSKRRLTAKPSVEPVELQTEVRQRPVQETSITPYQVELEGVDDDFQNQLRQILGVKFAQVANELKKVMRPAIRGQRKGLLIFKPHAAREIYDIKDEFIKYVVRSVYDNYADLKNGVFWRIHMNELFSGDFVKSVIRQLNKNVDDLENEYEKLKKTNLDNSEMQQLREKERKYNLIFRKNNPDNVFNSANEQSKPFYESYRQLKEKVKREHPRVPDDKMYRFIQNDYNYRQDFQKIEKEFKNTFPEYVKLESKIQEIYEEGWAEERKLSDKIKEELSKINYESIRKPLEKMIMHFTGTIAKSIYNGSLLFGNR